MRFNMKPLMAGAMLSVAALSSPAPAAEKLTISVIKAATYGCFFIAQDRGYFAANGLEVQFAYFDSSPPVAVAVVAGDLDFGIAATSAGFFNLADKLRIIGGFAREERGFQGMTFVASLKGWDAGVHSLKDLGGHSISIGTVGSSPHYSLSLIEAKYGIDPKSIRLVPLQSASNQASALIGGQVDAGVTISTVLMPAVKRGETKLLGFVGDETPWQLSSIFTGVKMAERRDTVERFLRAYRQGAHDYINAFTGPTGERREGPSTQAVLEIIGKYVGQTPEQIKPAIGYVEPDARLDVSDLQRQVDWYVAQGMLKTRIDVGSVIDTRYVVPLAPR
jgi:NitT/TauT family transport system substrate-binding protein